MAEPVDFYFDFISPYAYVGSTQIDAIAARYGRKVNWRPVLIGITVLKIMGLKPLPETPMKGDYLRHDGPRMAKAFGVPFRQHGFKGANSLAACRSFLWLKAQDEALAVRFAHRIFKKLWADGIDITPPESVAEEAAALGVDTKAMLAAIATDAGKKALNEAVDHAIKVGAFGVPYVVVDGEPIWGCDRLWMLEHWLAHGTWDGAGTAGLAKAAK